MARWGIMGTGGIAATMTRSLEAHGSPVVVVGSERPGAAQRFAMEHGIDAAVDSHQAVAAHPGVDIVYVATTNDRHHRNVLDCVAAGTPALCEKPIALNRHQAAEMFAAARAAGVFVLEGMWSRFQPYFARLDELIAGGGIGRVEMVHAVLAFPAPATGSRRWLTRELGGGALLDLGVYPLSLVHHLAGPPETYEASARLSPAGVDTDVLVVSRHRDGIGASVASSFTADLGNEGTVAGTEGLIRIHAPVHHSPRLTVMRRGEEVAWYDTSVTGHGFRLEVEHAEWCLAEGLTESPMRPHADTLAVMEWMDGIRAQCGIDYDADSL